MVLIWNNLVRFHCLHNDISFILLYIIAIISRWIISIMYNKINIDKECANITDYGWQ